MSIEPAKEGTKTVYARMGIWYEPEQGMIHLTIPGSGWFHTTVSNKPGSKRYHPNLFGKLKRVLSEQGRWPGERTSVGAIPAQSEDPAETPDIASPAEVVHDADLESEFHTAMVGIYTRAKSEAGYHATRFIQMLSELGGLQAARQLLDAPQVSEGFTHLWERKRLDLSVEALILDQRWALLFSDEDRARARDRLRSYGHDV